MDIYDTWVYTHIFNTAWFIYSVIAMVFALNVLGPVILWFICRDSFYNKKKRKL